MPSTTHADVLARRRRLLLSGDADGYADLFAPDGVTETPSPRRAPPHAWRVGRRLASTRARSWRRLRLEAYEVGELYQTQDPEVVIAEMRTKGTLATTGRSFAATSIQILRIRQGQIVLFRDFANSRILEDLIRQPRPAAASCG